MGANEEHVPLSLAEANARSMDASVLEIKGNKQTEQKRKI